MIIRLFESKEKRQKEIEAEGKALAGLVEVILDDVTRRLVGEQRASIKEMRDTITAIVDERVNQASLKLTKEVDRKFDRIMALLKEPLKEVPPSVELAYLKGILLRKGQAGDPVICDACGTVFSARRDSCDNCLKRKDKMGASSFPRMG